MKFLRTAAATFLSAAVLLSAGSAHSAGQVYECKFKYIAENGAWVPEVAIVGHVKGMPKGWVDDPVIEYFIGHPIEAKVETDNDKRTTFTWEVRVKSGSNQSARMQYRLTVFKADLKAQIVATPVGYEGNYSAGGSCKPTKA